MNAASGGPGGVRQAIVVDELGIAIGVHEAYRLKSAYRPLFSKEGDKLVPIGVKASTVPFTAGKQVAFADFRAGLDSADVSSVIGLCSALGLANYRHVGIDGLDLWVGYHPILNGELSPWLDETVDADDYEVLPRPRRLVCEFDASEEHRQALIGHGGTLREKGFGVAIGVFGSKHLAETEFGLSGPDIVRVEAGWFAQAYQDGATARLLGTVISRLRHRGIKVLVEGIASPGHLRVAHKCGADLFQGDYLAPAALGGTVFKLEPLSIRRLLDEPYRVTRHLG
jgi:EAL domain-containing protein (putative c-di-GMP-specific phosphodiesterase class I)